MRGHKRSRIISLAVAGIMVCQTGIASGTKEAQQWAREFISEAKQEQRLNDYIKQGSILNALDKPISEEDYFRLLTCSVSEETADMLYRQMAFNNTGVKNSITREEAVTAAGKICRLKSYSKVSFIDGQDIASDAYTYISAFQEQGIVVGYKNKKFMPKNEITAAEAIVIVCKLIQKGFISSNSVTDLAAAKSGYIEGEVLKTDFFRPVGLCRDKNKGIIVVDSYNNLIRRISDQKVETIAGKQTSSIDLYGIPIGGYINGRKDEALFNKPLFAAVNAKGEVLVSDTENNSIRLISNGKVAALNNGILAGYRDGKLEAAMFNKPSDLVFDEAWNIYVADTQNNCIRYIDMQKSEVTTFAGMQSKSGLKDGPAENALFNKPVGLALDKNGVLYVSDSGNQRIRKIEKGIVSTIAGAGDSLLEGTDCIEGGYADGIRTQARFNFPGGIDVNDNGIIFVADTGNHRIRAITSTSVITLAGNGEAAYFSGISRASSFNEPSDVLVNGDKVYVSDTFNSKIRLINIDTSWKWD
ncbi:S-layer family protein [Ruminiclostridium sufflavum DSM 19573]|uniref:S-layer family protein n=1 Tax=Ruminiclostridium sufflavum DSM 19573 TaxID=1121337 RepID=A0A318XHA7_9FIRM|nr:S-layer homology domain-containing protein [Ruminiclostridium sufflavum]PYG85809.1 S-layer family protein [Ruminiclostridium sufflavum DSM 19573]